MLESDDVSQQPSNSFRYLYERLGDKRFQQLCSALLAHVFPDITCYPVGQADGGRDAVQKLADSDVIYEVKWTSKRQQDPVAWLTKAYRPKPRGGVPLSPGSDYEPWVNRPLQIS